MSRSVNAWEAQAHWEWDEASVPYEASASTFGPSHAFFPAPAPQIPQLPEDEHDPDATEFQTRWWPNLSADWE